MTTPFIRTTRSLTADKSSISRPLGLLFLTVALLWTVWLTGAQIVIYKVSTIAHLRQSGNLVNVTAPVGGQVEALSMSLGKTVNEGDLLVDFRQESLLSDIQGTANLIADVEDQLTALTTEEAAENEHFRQAQESQQKSIEQIRQRLASLQEVVKTVAQIAAQYQELLSRGQGSRVEYLDKEAARQQAEVAVLDTREELQQAQANLTSLANEQTLTAASINTRRLLLRKELTRLKNIAAGQSIESRNYKLTAPTDGVIASLQPLDIGDNVEQGSVVCTIRTDGSLSVEAYFSPAEALGHVKPGQTARVQLEGFAWTNYGRIPARVRSVASAIRDGSVRVELQIDGQVPTGLPLAHDVPALVEVATGVESPLSLLLQRFAEWETSTSRRPVVGPS